MEAGPRSEDGQTVKRATPKCETDAGTGAPRGPQQLSSRSHEEPQRATWAPGQEAVYLAEEPGALRGSASAAARAARANRRGQLGREARAAVGAHHHKRPRAVPGASEPSGAVAVVNPIPPRSEDPRAASAGPVAPSRRGCLGEAPSLRRAEPPSRKGAIALAARKGALAARKGAQAA
jgi:hypothetical protein